MCLFSLYVSSRNRSPTSLIFFCSFFFFFNDTAPTEIYTLSLHDALPICCWRRRCCGWVWSTSARCWRCRSEEHTSELQSRENIVCRLLLENKNTNN